MELLKLAIELGDLRLCKRFVENGADPGVEYDSCLGCTPLLHSLHDHKGTSAIAEYLLIRGAKVNVQTISTPTGSGYTAFHYAAAYGFSGLLRLLQEKAPTAMSQLCRSPVHPIRLAVEHEHIECVDVFLDHDHKVHVTPALHKGSLIKYDDVLDLSNISTRNNEMFFDWTLSDEYCIGKTRPNATPLHLPVRTGNVKIAELLFKRGARVNLADNQGTCPLLRAAYKSDHAMIKLLLSNGANPNVVDLDLQGPCVTLASRGALGCLEEVVKSRADLALRDNGGRTALDYAAVSGATDVFAFLVMKGLKLNSKSM